jgi:hypothetical protein
VPLPAIPKLPAPVVAAQPATPTSAASPPAVAGASQAVSGARAPLASSGGSSAAGRSGGSSSAPAAGSGSATSGPRVEHFNSSRPWIGTKGPKRRRVTTLTFVLPVATRVIFTVNQVSPVCRGIGHFSVAGHAGLNRVRFAGRVHHQRLSPGTYRIAARTAAGRILRRIILVVVGGSAPSHAELQSLRAANSCAAAATAGTRTSSSGSSTSLPKQPLPSPMSQAPKISSGLGVTHGPNMHAGVLATSVERTARAIRPLLVALLGLSVLLLALASVPRVAVAEPRLNYMLARHRLEIAGLGAAALIAVAITFLVA